MWKFKVFYDLNIYIITYGLTIYNANHLKTDRMNGMIRNEHPSGKESPASSGPVRKWVIRPVSQKFTTNTQ